ncbi:MAG: TetR/AcrR family transcriptional regulator [Lachnospiraceae bacterium]|nr:TetR/AcrR family transcriptional regulator [Lachnospiraceae bacterium]
MPKRINDTKLRKQQILKSARKVFLEKGFQGATIDDIAKEEGVVRGTILYHYKSKEHLMEAVLEEEDEAWAPFLASLVTRHEIPVMERIDRMFALCEMYFVNEKAEIDQYKENPAETRFLLDQMRLKNFYRQAEGLTALLEEGTKAGEFSLENPRIQAASAMFAVFGITGTDISPEELKAELQIIKEQLLSSCGNDK